MPGRATVDGTALSTAEGEPPDPPEPIEADGHLGDGAGRRWGRTRLERRQGPPDGRGGGQGEGPPLAGSTPAELFGRALHYLRRGRGLRLIDLAPRANMSPARVSAIENGEYHAWEASADDLARALDFPDAVSLLRAFYGSDYPPPAASGSDYPPPAASGSDPSSSR